MINEDVCCTQECGTCGGSDCASRPGGGINCCESEIRNSSNICSSDEDVACKIPKGIKKLWLFYQNFNLNSKSKNDFNPVECPSTGAVWDVIQNQCYSTYTNLNKSDAQNYCNNIGGKIFEPRDETTYKIVHSFYVKYEFKNSWIGITGEEISPELSGGWFDWSHVSWSYDSDNTLVTFENWKRFKPYGSKDTNCAIMDFKAEAEMSWDNVMCNKTYTFVICETN